jgi:hypothetical protein
VFKFAVAKGASMGASGQPGRAFVLDATCLALVRSPHPLLIFLNRPLRISWMPSSSVHAIRMARARFMATSFTAP